MKSFGSEGSIQIVNRKLEKGSRTSNSRLMGSEIKYFSLASPSTPEPSKVEWMLKQTSACSTKDMYMYQRKKQHQKKPSIDTVLAEKVYCPN